MSCVCVCQLLHFVKKNNNNIEKTKKITNISVRFEREVRDGVHSEQSLVFKLKKKKKNIHANRSIICGTCGAAAAAAHLKVV